MHQINIQQGRQYQVTLACLLRIASNVLAWLQACTKSKIHPVLMSQHTPSLPYISHNLTQQQLSIYPNKVQENMISLEPDVS